MRPQRTSYHRSRARSLRVNMTRQERHLWYDFLHDYPVHFYRQRTFGNYIVDFYCERARLVVELDGYQHGEPQAKEYDAKRTAYLETYGLKVIRFSNLDVKYAFENTCDTIHKVVQERSRCFCGGNGTVDLPGESQDPPEAEEQDGTE